MSIHEDVIIIIIVACQSSPSWAHAESGGNFIEANYTYIEHSIFDIVLSSALITCPCNKANSEVLYCKDHIFVTTRNKRVKNVVGTVLN